MANEYIFLIDDDEEVLGTLSRALGRENYEVDFSTSGAEGLDRLAEQMPDLLILDIIMPNMTGIEVCQTLRADSTYNHLPILFLSAKTTTDEVIEGLQAGADDYIVKPFQITDLNARIRALLRRAQRYESNPNEKIQVGSLIIDNMQSDVSVDGKMAQLTTTEYRLLRYLMEHVGQPLSTDHLLQAVWDYPPETGDTDLVRAHVRNLRKKVEPNPSSPTYVRTKHGIGYVLADPTKG